MMRAIMTHNDTYNGTPLSEMPCLHRELLPLEFNASCRNDFQDAARILCVVPRGTFQLYARGLLTQPAIYSTGSEVSSLSGKPRFSQTSRMPRSDGETPEIREA